MLGAVTWASMPITFSLAWFGYAEYLFMFVATKFFTVSLLQIHLRIELKRFFQHWEPGSPWQLALDKADTWGIASSSIAERIVAILGLLPSLAGGIFDFMETVDPDLDTMTPGNARVALTHAQTLDFRRSWDDVPVIGVPFAYLGLPGILATGMAMIALWQIYIFCITIKSARLVIDRRFSGFYGFIFHIADCAGLLIFASRARLVHIHRWPDHANDREESYLARVPEMVFQTWFTVSVAVFTIRADTVWKSMPIFASILTSYCATAKTLYENIHEMIKGYDSKTFLLAMLFHAFFYLLITARVAGIWICAETHDLQLSRMRCRP